MSPKSQLYATLAAQLRSVLDGETDATVRMAHAAALIHEALGAWWTGFYRVTPTAADHAELLVGPYQGPLACTRIGRGRGVCGTAWAEDRTVVVEDVSRFAGHIACSAASRSEIVVPLHDAQGRVRAVLDIDSDRLAAFDDEDRRGLEALAALI